MTNTIDYNLNGQQYRLNVTINDVQIPTQNIQHFYIREWIFDHILTMDCEFMDVGTFVELNPLYDEAVVHIEFSKNANEDSVVLDFYVNDFEIDRQGINETIYYIHFTAVQKTTNFLMPVQTRVFANEIVSDIVEQIAEENDLTYVKKIESNDLQNWYQIAISNQDFISHLKKRSYIADEDIPFIYMTRDEELVYTSLKTECESNVKFDAYMNDVLVNDNGDDLALSKVSNITEKDSKIKQLYFRSDIKYKTISGTLNKTDGYGISFSYYDFKDFYYHYLNFNYGPMTKYVNENKNNSKQVVDTITYNALHKNVHANYLLGVTQNLYLGYLFFNSYIQISIRPDFDVKLFDKLNVIIPDATSQQLDNTTRIDKVHSGEYIVGGILHDIQKNGLYSMILILFRNGVNSSDVQVTNNLMESSK